MRQGENGNKCRDKYVVEVRYGWGEDGRSAEQGAHEAKMKRDGMHLFPPRHSLLAPIKIAIDHSTHPPLPAPCP